MKNIFKEWLEITPIEEKDWPEIDRLYTEIMNDPEYQRREAVFEKRFAGICLGFILLFTATMLILDYIGVI